MNEQRATEIRTITGRIVKAGDTVRVDPGKNKRKWLATFNFARIDAEGVITSVEVYGGPPNYPASRSVRLESVSAINQRRGAA